MSVHPTPVQRLNAQEDRTAGSAETFEDLFAATNQRLFTALWLVTGDRHEAEEIAQDAFLRVFERWDKVSRLDDPESYVFRAAMNVFRNRYRRAALAVRRSISIAPPAADELAAVEDRDEVIRLLRPLPPRQRAAVVATSILDLSAEEAGRVLGMRSATVRALASRARARMKDEAVDPPMTRNDDLLERLAPLSGAPSRGFEDLLRLRAKRQRAQKIGAIAVVTVLIATLGIGIATLGDREPTPADPPTESHPRRFTGMVIGFSGGLAAWDPNTGEKISVLDPSAPPAVQAGTDFAAASADGRWVAFDSCGDDTKGLWVTNGTDETRQPTNACLGDQTASEGLWAWSPTGSRLAAFVGGGLVLIDPATGEPTDLGGATGKVTSLAWSPDGTQIAYATQITPETHLATSVYTVSVEGGEHTLLADSLGHVPGGEEGSGLAWSPDGTRIAVIAADPGPPRGTLLVMDADGSDRRPLAEQVLIEHVLGSPNLDWSPDGTRIAYATESDARDHFQVWSAALDGSAPVLVFEETTPGKNNALHGGPVWSPDGTRIAFREGADKTWLIADADGTSEAHEIDELQPLSWRESWYFCECYG